MPIAPPVTLSEDERRQLWIAAHRGKTNARALKHAQILLKVADGWIAAEIADALDVSASTVANVRRRWREGGVDAVLHDKRQERRRQALTGERRTAKDYAAQLHYLAVLLAERYEGLRQQAPFLLDLNTQADTFLQDFGGQLADLGKRALQAAQYVLTAADALFTAFFIVTIMVYLVADGERIQRYVVGFARTDHREAFRDLLNRMGDRVGWRGKGIIEVEMVPAKTSYQFPNHRHNVCRTDIAPRHGAAQPYARPLNLTFRRSCRVRGCFIPQREWALALGRVRRKVLRRVKTH